MDEGEPKAALDKIDPIKPAESADGGAAAADRHRRRSRRHSSSPSDSPRPVVPEQTPDVGAAGGVGGEAERPRRNVVSPRRVEEDKPADVHSSPSEDGVATSHSSQSGSAEEKPAPVQYSAPDDTEERKRKGRSHGRQQLRAAAWRRSDGFRGDMETAIGLCGCAAGGVASNSRGGAETAVPIKAGQPTASATAPRISSVVWYNSIDASRKTDKCRADGQTKACSLKITTADPSNLTERFEDTFQIRFVNADTNLRNGYL
jgi:hypothetical protein